MPKLNPIDISAKNDDALIAIKLIKAHIKQMSYILNKIQKGIEEKRNNEKQQ